LTIRQHFKAATPRRNHFQLGVGKALPDLRRQTGGARLV